MKFSECENIKAEKVIAMLSLRIIISGFMSSEFFRKFRRHISRPQHPDDYPRII